MTLEIVNTGKDTLPAVV